MADSPPTRAVKAALLSAALALVACPSTGVDLCNVDSDCASAERCALGVCTPEVDPPADAGGDDAGREDAGSTDAGRDDAGDADAGPSDAGQGDAGPVDAGGCPATEHDGGDGQCVPLGECSQGFLLYFLDADLDGVGDGALSEDCAPDPLEPSRAASAGDCEPLDPTRFQLQQGFDDYDEDSYTAGPAEACVGDVPKQGLVSEERGPPHLAHAWTATSSGSSNPWNSASNGWGCCGGTTTADLDPFADTALLVLSDVDCVGVPARLDRVRVRARVRLPAISAPQALTLAATLVPSGSPGAALDATSTWLPNTFTQVELEGTPAQWGLAGNDPAALCGGALEVQVLVQANGSYGGSVELDYAVVELLGDSDCDPASAALYSPMGLYGDGDGDSYVGGASLAGCVGDATRDDWEALVSVDCDDDDDRAHPGQTSYFNGQRTNGGWDYDCNGAEDKRAVGDATGCAEDATESLVCVETGSTKRTGACGGSVDADRCPAAAPCSLIQDTATQACR